MNLLPNTEIIDLGLSFKKHHLLAIGDVHIGYEEALNKQGIFVPRFAFKEMMEHMENMLQECVSKIRTNNKENKNKFKKLAAVLINGDLKHEFGTISETEWRHTIRFLKLLQQYTDRIILIKGNHDTVLAPIAKTKGLEVFDYYILDDILFVHGDTIPKILTDKNTFQKIKTIIIGHEHPAVTVSQWPRMEKYKAFLVGSWQKKKLIVLPSFNVVTEGTDVLKEQLLSPFLHQSLDNFDCYILGDKSYYFGKLKNLKKK